MVAPTQAPSRGLDLQDQTESTRVLNEKNLGSGGTGGEMKEQEFQICTTRWHLPIAPMHVLEPLEGVHHHLDPLVMTYVPELGGILLALQELKFLTEYAQIHGDSPFAWAWVQSKALVWTPRVGMKLRGRVNLVSPSHIGLLLHSTFNASVPMSEHEDWCWHDDVEREEGGWWERAGEEVKGEFELEVSKIIRVGKLISVEGRPLP